MSSIPNGPKGGDAGNRQGGSPTRPALEQTFLGVAPPLNPPPAPAAANPPAAKPATASPAAPDPAEPVAPHGSVIVAAPMISLSGASARGTGAAPAVSAAPAPTPPAPGLASTVPPVQLGGGWESANVMPRPGNPDRTIQQGTPRALLNAAAQPRAAFPQQLPRNPAPEPRPRQALDPRAPVAPQPLPDLGAQHGTALASDYLRQARDAVLGASPVPARPQASALPPRAATAAQSPPLSADATAPSVAPGVIAAAGGVPQTTELPAMADLHPTPAAPAAWGAAPERFGTQASVAPPPLEPDAARLPPPPPAASRPPVAAAPAAPAPMAAVAPVPVQLHSAAPHSLAGTMLEPPPSAGHALSPRATSSASAPSLSSRFESVPAPRVPIGEQGSSALQIPIDQSLAEWNQTNAGPAAGITHTRAPQAKDTASSPGRLIGLGVVAVLAIGFATFGDQLLGKSQKQHPVRARPSATGAADLETAPAPPNPSAVGMPSPGTSVSATKASLTAAPTTAVTPVTMTAPTLPKASPDVASSEVAADDEAEAAAESPREKAAAAERRKAAEAQASPEELSAANAARNVITGRYAEALPLYQELARNYPQNAAYAAMARVLKQKTATSAPAVAPKVSP